MKICVALSGGVDSSVAAALLVEQGHDVIGVHMKLHDAPQPAPGAPAKHCCGLDDALDARRVAATLGVPFFVMDLRDAFRRAVMDDLADTYLAGATPNPCIRCNGVLKFNVLLQRARALGCTHLATGHYARISSDGCLQAAVDRDKDQSYFLFPVPPQTLASTLFPLGSLRKSQVRAHAERLGLKTAHKPESQEICFVPDDDHAHFVQQHRPGVDGAGQIVDDQGRVLGTHDAYFRFTLGQRRGLGVSVGSPVYVLAIDPDSHQVTVGPPASLLHHHIELSGMVWQRQPRPGEAIDVRVRHSGTLLRCRLDPLSSRSAGHEAGHEADQEMGSLPGDLGLTLLAPAWAATPGQAAVLYSGDDVLAGGWIQRASQKVGHRVVPPVVPRVSE